MEPKRNAINTDLILYHFGDNSEKYQYNKVFLKHFLGPGPTRNGVCPQKISTITVQQLFTRLIDYMYRFWESCKRNRIVLKFA